MSYEEMSLKSFVDEMKEVTDGFHPRKFCFVLGAGASRSSGIKSGQELVKIWDKELRERNETTYQQWRAELSITDENMSSFYSQYYERRFRRCPTDGYNYIEKIMETATPSAGYVMLAHLLTKTPHNVVITTNFDHLTEDAVNYYAQNTPLVIGHEALSHYISGQPVRPTIIKIHRDLLFDPKSRSEDLERLPDSWRNALELIFANYHPIFIGYAGNDKSLMDFLTENAQKFASDEWKYPYWMLYETDKLEGRVAEFLEKSEGIYICHSGFDKVMIQLGAAFDYPLPNEETFLKDARNRYKALVDTIDALSAPPKANNIAETVSGSVEKVPETVPGPAKYAEGEDNVNQAIEKITNQSEQQRMYREASGLMRTNEYAKAAEIQEQLVKMDENNVRYHRSLAEAFFQIRDKTEDSLTEYRKAAELDPGNGDDHFYIGLLLQRTEQYEAALNEYYKASAIGPDDAINHLGIAKMLVKTNRNEEAVKEAQRALSFDPNYAPTYTVLSQALQALGRIEEAKQAAKKAEELGAKGK